MNKLEFDHKHFPVDKKLHTDILEEKYGPVHVDVIRHDNIREVEPGQDCIREARIIDKNNILRTYALTFLTYDRNDSEILTIDEKIKNGGLIGKTFREYGYEIRKNVIDVFIETIPDWMKNDFKVDSREAKARLTEFYAKKDKQTPIIYGKVLEIYSPDFKDPKEGVNETDINQINPTTDTLLALDVSIDEIWNRLDKADETDEWRDIKERYNLAKKLSKPILEDLHSKINKHLQR